MKRYIFLDVAIFHHNLGCSRDGFSNSQHLLFVCDYFQMLAFAVTNFTQIKSPCKAFVVTRFILIKSQCESDTRGGFCSDHYYYYNYYDQ